MPAKKKVKKALTLDQIKEILAGFDDEFLFKRDGDAIESVMLEDIIDADTWNPEDPIFYDREDDENHTYDMLSEKGKLYVCTELVYARDKVYPAWKGHREKQQKKYERDQAAKKKLEQRILLTLSGLKLKKKSNWEGNWTELAGKLTMDYSKDRAGLLMSILDEPLAVELTDPEDGKILGKAELTMKDAGSAFVGGIHKIVGAITMKPKKSEIAPLMSIDGRAVLAEIKAKQVSFEDFAKPFDKWRFNL